MKTVDGRVSRPAEEGAEHLRRANASLDDEATWLAHLNRCFGRYGLGPLELRPGDEPRLLRIGAKAPRRIETGPLVSMLMPAWNAEATLEWAAASVLNQTWRPVELLIVDDASTDGTWRIAQELAARDGRVRAMRLPANAGPYVARNVALREARGDYIMGLDADEWTHPERLERRMEAMLADRGRRGSQDMMLRIGEDGRIAEFEARRPGEAPRMLRKCFSGVCLEAKFFREALGHFDGVRFGADAELIERARMLLEERFAPERLLGVLSLHEAKSLSRDPEHGSTRQGGLSPVRKEYQRNYHAWHARITPGNSALPFPHEPRRFAAPEAMRVKGETLERVIRDFNAGRGTNGSEGSGGHR